MFVLHIDQYTSLDMMRSYISFALMLTSAVYLHGQAEMADTSTTALSTEQFIQPRFPGCEDDEVPGKYKYLCSQKKFVAYLDRVVDYPKDARNEGVQGKVIITFIIEEDGSMTNQTVERTPDDRLSAECLKALDFTIEDEYIWRPATLNGEPIRSIVRMPIDFRLGYKSIKSKKPITNVNIPDIMESAQVDANGRAMLSEMSIADSDKVYDDVEKNPYFQGCDEADMTLIDRYKCSRKSYYAYIEKQVEYPAAAKADRIQGIAKIECIVEKDGSVTNPRLLRDPGAGLGEEAMRIITAMKDSVGIWSPGKIGDMPVRTKMELPVRFRLAPNDIQPLIVLRHAKKKVLHDCTRMHDPLALNAIDGVKVKKYKSAKVGLEYGEKGRYGVYIAKVSKKLGKKPSALKKLEEVEAYEMYFKGMTVDDADDMLDIQFDEVSADGQIIVYALSGRTIEKIDLAAGEDAPISIDMSRAKGQVFFVSVIQKDLVHTHIVVL